MRIKKIHKKIFYILENTFYITAILCIAIFVLKDPCKKCISIIRPCCTEIKQCSEKKCFDTVEPLEILIIRFTSLLFWFIILSLAGGYTYTKIF